MPFINCGFILSTLVVKPCQTGVTGVTNVDMNVKAYYQEGSKLSVWHSNRKNKQRNVTLEESLEGGDTDVSINHWIRRERVFLPSI